jgi:hypothetical protein
MKELINERFSFEIAGTRASVYLTAIPDWDNINDGLEPSSAEFYTVMTQIDSETSSTDYLTLNAARHFFMVAVNELINTIDK